MVMHPLTFTAGSDDSRAAQVSQMSRYLRLRLAKNFDQVAHTDLLVAHQVQQSQPGVVAERLKEKLDREDCLFCGHNRIISALTNMYIANIVVLTNMISGG